MKSRRRILGEVGHACLGAMALAAAGGGAAALKEAGNEVRIELAGDGTVMMRTPVANSVTAVGWPPFSQALAKVIDLKIPIYV